MNLKLKKTEKTTTGLSNRQIEELKLKGKKVVLFSKVFGKVVQETAVKTVREGWTKFKNASDALSEEASGKIVQVELKRFKEQKMKLKKLQADYKAIKKRLDCLEKDISFYDKKEMRQNAEKLELNKQREEMSTENPTYERLLQKIDDIEESLERDKKRVRKLQADIEILNMEKEEIISRYAKIQPQHNAEWNEFKEVYKIGIEQKDEESKFHTVDSNPIAQQVEKVTFEDFTVEEELFKKTPRNLAFLAGNPATKARAKIQDVEVIKNSLLFEIMHMAQEYDLKQNDGLGLWEKDGVSVCFYQDAYLIFIEKESNQVKVAEFDKENSRQDIIGEGTSLRDIIWNDVDKKQNYENLLVNIYNDIMELKLAI
ncbi:hypothetical protein [Bacillus thuringiensis]|uniref:hypothetical protein n=1 Tax=Bacillus thuringiensis TaxID=1428 RepID=UPI0021D6700D|nr:hypothetical protein [Bacillus thuringiensis]MCU7667373.1 hypothetical protein [Bacillus thuringiensis]